MPRYGEMLRRFGFGILNKLMKTQIYYFGYCIVFLQLVMCSIVLGESPNPIVERLNRDPLSEDMKYTYKQTSGVFIFSVTRPHRPDLNLFVMAEGKLNENAKYGNIQDFSKSLDSLIQIIKRENTFLDYLSINLSSIDEVPSRICKAASESPEWRHRKPLKVPDVGSYGDLVGEIILQKHVLKEIEDVLLKNRFKMINIGMENLVVSKSSDGGDGLPVLSSCAEISIQHAPGSVPND